MTTRDQLKDGADTSASEATSSKLTAELAQRLRSAKPESRLAVLVEIATPRPQVQFAPQNRDGEVRLRPKSVEVDAATSTAVFDQAVAYFETRPWSGHEPVFIRAASAVSMEVSADELADIVKQPFVRAVSLNQRHSPQR